MKKSSKKPTSNRILAVIGVVIGLLIVTSVAGAATRPQLITTSTEQVSSIIPFENQDVNDSTLTSGTTKITQVGMNGTKVTTYEVTKTNGTETSRKQTTETTTVVPIDQITTHGTYVAPVVQKLTSSTLSSSGCDPNYSGACVPIASDVDCAGGSGNGPAYVQGPVTVIGTDIYKLDSNGNGIGCE